MATGYYGGSVFGGDIGVGRDGRRGIDDVGEVGRVLRGPKVAVMVLCGFGTIPEHERLGNLRDIA